MQTESPVHSHQSDARSASAAHPSRSMQRDGQWLMVGGGLLLGTLGVFIEEAGQPALTAVWFRCVFGLLALSAWFAATGRWGAWRLAPRDMLLAVVAGLFMVLSWALFFEAVTRVSMSVATLVVHVQPFLIMAFGAAFLGDRPSAGQWAAAALALLGLGLAVGGWSAFTASELHAAVPLGGIGLALAAAVAYAAAPLTLRSVRSGSGLVLAWWQCLAGSVALAWWPLVQGLPAWGSAWAWLAAMGVVHTGLAYVLLYSGIQRLPAARMALLQFVYPASAIAFDALVYGRVLGTDQLLGVALLMSGLLMAVRQRGQA